MATLTFLDLNGHQFTASQNDLFIVAIMVAKNELSIEALAKWISQNTF